MGEAKPQPIDETDEVFVDELKPGTELMHGQYTIESFLNAGGFGITYNARDSLDRRVVIKECFPGAFCRRSRYMVNARSRAHQTELESIVRLFVQEARSLAKLDHPNIVGVHNVFEENNTAYMALDFVEGRDLLDIIEDEDAVLTPDQAVSILRDILAAVGFIHEQGILHRDISPDNILVDTNMHPVLIDFGAAREQASKQSRVLSALRVVKDGYSPQEFYIQGSDQGPYSDLYALGASFYHMISGDTPPNSQARLAAIASGQEDPYKPLKGTIPGMDDNFLDALDQSLKVLPKDRLQSADDWLALIDGRHDPIAAAVAETVKNANAPESEPAKPAPQKGIADETDAENTIEAKSKAALLMATTAVLALLAGGFLAMQAGLLGGAEAADATDTMDADTAIEESRTVGSSDTTEVASSTVVSTTDTGAPAESMDTAVSEEDTADRSQAPTTIFEAAAALAAEEDTAVLDSATSPTEITPDDNAAVRVPEVSATITGNARIVSGDMTLIAAPVGAPQGVAEGPFDVVATAPTTTAATVDLEPALDVEVAILSDGLTPLVPRPLARPEDGPLSLDTLSEPLSITLATSSSVGAQVSEMMAQGASPGFPAFILIPQDTPNMPIETSAPPAIAGSADRLGIPVMNALPPLPVSVDGPLGLPSIDLPVFPFAAEVVETVEPSGTVMTASSVVLPYSGLFSATENETQIYSVNGQTVESQSEFNDVIRATNELDELTEVTVLVETGIVGQNAVQEQTWTLPVAQETGLLNGVTFRSISQGDTWQTRVVAVPEGVASDLMVGDVVLAYVPTTELLNERGAITELIEREVSAGTAEFSFAVMRDGATWVASLTYENPLTGVQD